MSDLSTAQQMVDYYKHMPARIRSQPIHVQFSMHEHLKVSMFLSFASEQNCHSTGFFCYFPQLVVLLQAADYVAGQAMSARQNCFIVSCYLLLFVEYKITNCKYCSCLIGVHTNRGKSSNLKLRISRPGKVVEKALGRRKFWKSPWKWNVVVLEFYRVTWLSVTWFQLSRYSNPAWPIAVQ